MRLSRRPTRRKCGTRTCSIAWRWSCRGYSTGRTGVCECLGRPGATRWKKACDLQRPGGDGWIGGRNQQGAWVSALAVGVSIKFYFVRERLGEFRKQFRFSAATADRNHRVSPLRTQALSPLPSRHLSSAPLRSLLVKKQAGRKSDVYLSRHHP